jgi:hypothetical protein
VHVLIAVICFPPLHTTLSTHMLSITIFPSTQAVQFVGPVPLQFLHDKSHLISHESPSCPAGHTHLDLTHVPSPLQAPTQATSRQRAFPFGQWMNPSNPGTGMSPPVNGHSMVSGVVRLSLSIAEVVEQDSTSMQRPRSFSDAPLAEIFAVTHRELTPAFSPRLVRTTVATLPLPRQFLLV